MPANISNRVFALGSFGYSDHVIQLVICSLLPIVDDIQLTKVESSMASHIPAQSYMMTNLLLGTHAISYLQSCWIPQLRKLHQFIKMRPESLPELELDSVEWPRSEGRLSDMYFNERLR